jgi:ornithine decarboxylase
MFLPYFLEYKGKNSFILELLFKFVQAEIMKVLDLGVDPSRIIYANPCKQNSYIKYAAKKHVEMMTFDNEDELHKVKALFPDAK